MSASAPLSVIFLRLPVNSCAVVGAAKDSPATRDRSFIGGWIAAVGGVCNHFLKRRTHRHVEVYALRWDWLLKPLCINRIDLTTFVDGRHRAIDHFFKSGILTPQHDTVRLDR